jgi:DNA-binding NarL/FixJ family response regulator
MTERRIRVVLVDDHPIVLAGIKALLNSAPEIDLIGEATNGLAALALIQAEKPDIAVLDLTMPGLSGLDLADRISELAPSVSMIALTVHEDRAYVQPLLEAGAKGYLLKRSAAEDLVRAIRAVSAGGIYLDPAVADKALRRAAPSAAADNARLSPREVDVMRLAARGFSNKETAARLEISVKTVETHRARACDKLSLRTRSEIVRFGAAQGWLDDLGRLKD